MNLPEIDAQEHISLIRSWVADALHQLDSALRSKDKLEKRRTLLCAGGVLHASVRELEQLLKVEPPRA